MRGEARQRQQAYLARQGKETNAQGEAREGQDNTEARQELKFHTKTTGRRKQTVGKM